MSSSNYYELISSFYDPLKWMIFGNHLNNAEKHFLEQIPDNSRILFIGGGSGQLLIPILESGKARSIDYIDHSPSMISKAKKRIKNHSSAGQVNFLCIDFLKAELNYRSDVVITNFFMDQFDEGALNEIMNKVQALTCDKAHWLFTDFEPGEIWWHKFITKIMFLFFKITTRIPIHNLPEWEHLFGKDDIWNLKSEKSFYGELVKSRIYSRKEVPKKKA